MSKSTNKFSREVRERAVRMVLDNEGQHGSRGQAITSISAKIGCSANTLDDWVKKAEVDSGKRAGVPSEMAESAGRSQSDRMVRGTIRMPKRRPWSGRTGNSGRRMRSCARRQRRSRHLNRWRDAIDFAMAELDRRSK